MSSITKTLNEGEMRHAQADLARAVAILKRETTIFATLENELHDLGLLFQELKAFEIVKGTKKNAQALKKFLTRKVKKEKRLFRTEVEVIGRLTKNLRKILDEIQKASAKISFPPQIATQEIARLQQGLKELHAHAQQLLNEFSPHGEIVTLIKRAKTELDLHHIFERLRWVRNYHIQPLKILIRQVEGDFSLNVPEESNNILKNAFYSSQKLQKILLELATILEDPQQKSLITNLATTIHTQSLEQIEESFYLFLHRVPYVLAQLRVKSYIDEIARALYYVTRQLIEFTKARNAGELYLERNEQEHQRILSNFFPIMDQLMDQKSISGFWAEKIVTDIKTLSRSHLQRTRRAA